MVVAMAAAAVVVIMVAVLMMVVVVVRVVVQKIEPVTTSVTRDKDKFRVLHQLTLMRYAGRCDVDKYLSDKFTVARRIDVLPT